MPPYNSFCGFCHMVKLGYSYWRSGGWYFKCNDCNHTKVK